jgi:type VI secretion system FHA domain protein
MKLTLRIENVSYLPDGGPIEHSVMGKGFEIGRERVMDWVLPDGNVSRRHMEIVWQQGGYWLNDVSSNGTFIYGQSQRLPSPYQLQHNDRLLVGPYIVRVVIEAGAVIAAPGGMSADPWDIFGSRPAPTPIPPVSRAASPISAGFQDAFIPNPEPPSSPFSTMPGQDEQIRPAQPMPIGKPPEPVENKNTTGQFPAQAPRPSAPAIGDPGAATFLQALTRGAGLPPGSLDSADPAQLGEEVGRCLRIATEQMMALLNARAAAKQFVKSGSRTMIGGTNNNPLKFKPSATEALDSMFVRRSESYLTATKSFEQGFEDIQRHQVAVYAAIQPALARLLEDLSPEAIEARTTGGIVASKKARAWETFVERWDAKTHPYENGMLDVFLAYFAEAYDAASRKKGN